MLVKVSTSLAGGTFAYSAGQIVDREVFASHVGNGWDTLSEPYGEVVVDVQDELTDELTEEVIVAEEPERAVLEPVVEQSVKYRRRR